MRKFLIVLLVLAVAGLIGADRLIKGRAETEVARQVAAQYRLTERPEVRIDGFPFLTQALGGEYERITVDIGDYTQQGVTVRELEIVLNGLNAPLSDLLKGDQRNIRARTATASGVIPYEVLQEQVAANGVQKVSRKGDDVLLEGTFSFLGVPAPIGVSVSIEPTAQGIVITPETVQSGGIEVPLALLKRNLTTTVPVTGLPMGSRITAVEPVDAGLRVTGTAQDVDLSGIGATLRNG
jgi:hypothetical protein